jgi:hypothetical protein
VLPPRRELVPAQEPERVPALALAQGEVAEGVAEAYGRPQLLARLLLVRTLQSRSPQCPLISPLVKQLLSAPARKLARM